MRDRCSTFPGLELRRRRHVRARISCRQFAHSYLRRAHAAGDRSPHVALAGLRSRYGGASLPLAAFAALLWTLHPLQTESVTYVSQRAESLMGLCYLLTLYGFIRSVRPDFTKDNEGNEVSGPKHGSLLPPLPPVKNPDSKPSGCANKSWLILSVAACLCGIGHQAGHGHRTRVGAALRPGVRQRVVSICAGEPALVLRESGGPPGCCLVF